jgi:2-polyprenyl-3-methyl-5-hydroxy-6-metoxy-1,4-benzoquinol methylase/glycosyltransferase involved in cell wall biosynthesis
MRLAFFSPLSPQKSGIADYSEELLPYLAEQAEIDLFVEGFEPSNRAVVERFRRFDYVADPDVLGRLRDYDAVLYHLGNDHRYHSGIYETARKFPGIVVLHDFALQDFFLGLSRTRGDFGIYLDELEACHGARAREEAAQAFERGGLPPHVGVPLLFPLNRRIARAAEAIIVHSEWSRARLRNVVPVTPVARINHHITARAAADEMRLAAPANRNGDAVRISSFGLITPDKGIERALRALAALKDDHSFHYTLVGAPNSFFDVRELVRRYSLGDRVTITDHVSLAEFEQRISETDIAINLRERTVGETSGSLCRIMAAGVASIVSGVGWFAELPDDAVVKIEMDGYTDALLHAYLKRLIEDAPLRARIGENARRHALASHRIEQSAARYLDFIREVIDGRTRRRFINSVSTEISRLRLDPDRDDSLLRKISAEVATLAPANASLSDTAPAMPGGEPMKSMLNETPIAPAPDAADEQRETEPYSPTSPTREESGAVESSATHEEFNAAMHEESDATNPSKHEATDETRDASTASSSSTFETTGSPAPSVSTASSVSTPEQPSAPPISSSGRVRKIEGLDYRRAAIEYPRKLDEERRRYLFTKPFYNLANKPPKHTGDGMDAETHRHFCDFANLAVALALPAGRSLLDVGCGSGWLSEYFARLGYDVTGIDISPDLIRMADERVERVPYDVDHRTPLRCRFLTHDIECAPLSKTFDAAVCYDSLHHFEDERAVMRHLAAMLDYGGLLFILEGDKPEEGSPTEEELVGVMREYETLESPFSREYLRELLREHGFVVVGDYVSVNGLFERDAIEDGRLRVEPPAVNYLLCKKVLAAGASGAAEVADSREPSRLAASLTFGEAWPEVLAPGAQVNRKLRVENTGDTLWLTGRAERRGSVMLALRLFDEAGSLVFERHGEPPLPRALAPREQVELSLDYRAPDAPGRYQLKLDLVAQHVAWFEHHGSTPLVLTFEVK